MGQLLPGRTLLAEFDDPVRKGLSEAQRNLAEHIDAAHKREIAARAVDHSRGLDCCDHAGRAGHDGRERRDGRWRARVHQHFAGNVAPGQVRHDRAPDSKVGQSPA